ncbi:NmrA domain-containing protein [Fusarium keratoplasticum]|uniref:NmrA domain-containing protein n=1 Tax=Fusarium keratoplasticum TaxID=1328300 RepID=A0ACC0QQS1_9HYPO|nr:NmrA domain-containing protein [Fusarium keratoplasticum]KAI8663201.1 NmrA domain-containing protein [Fusarium keratoplasticum]
MSNLKKIFIVGGTGAQGIPVVRDLAPVFALRILTRDPSSARAQQLLTYSPSPGQIELFQGTFESMSDLRQGLEGCWGVFINLDGFSVGEKSETFWTIRSYELAIELGLKSFVFGNLDYYYKKAGYKDEFRVGHADGKGRMGEWIIDQHRRNQKALAGYDMKVSLLTTGVYLDMAISSAGPAVPKVEVDEVTGEDILTWRIPLTRDGAVVHVALDDCGFYVRWLFENPQEADGRDLEVAIEHVHYDDLAKAFERVTGRKARFIDVDFETYWREGSLAQTADRPVGVAADASDSANMTIKQNFTGWWNIWRASGYNKGVIQRDYHLLDRIFPGRIRTAEQFLRRIDQEERKRGSTLWDKMVANKPILKVQEDGFTSVRDL